MTLTRLVASAAESLQRGRRRRRRARRRPVPAIPATFAGPDLAVASPAAAGVHAVPGVFLDRQFRWPGILIR